MQMFWLAKNGAQQGPMPLAQAQKLIDDGVYQPHHMAWIVGTPVWRTIAETPELRAGMRPPGTPLGADHPGATAAPPPPPPAANVPFSGSIKPHSHSPKPWRRYAARALDEAILAFLVELVFGAYLPLGGIQSSLALGVLSVLLLVPFETACLQHFETTVGKYFFGILVRNQHGTALTQAQSLERALRVAVFGGAIGVPLLGLFANFIAYLDIRRPEGATWDRATRCVVLYEDDTILRQVVGGLLLVGIKFGTGLTGLVHMLMP